MNILIIACLITLAASRSDIYSPETIDGSSIPPEPDAYSSELITNAQQHPNATREVVFNPFNSAPVFNATLSLSDLEWAWRINVSDFAAPNAVLNPAADGFDQTMDPHIVTTSYDFNWSGSKNWSVELNSTTARFCLTVADSLTDLPVNVTNTYTENDTNSTSCVSALGQACVDAILAGGKFIGSPINQNCQSPSQSWSAISECQSTLGYTSTESRSFDLATFSRGFSNHSSQNATLDFTNGGGWFGYFSSPQNGSGSNEYYTAINRLHVVMINPLLASGGSLEDGFTQNPQLLCMRVNATTLPTDDTNGDGVTWTSEAVLEGAESAGYSVQIALQGSLVVWLVSLMFSITVNTF